MALLVASPYDRTDRGGPAELRCAFVNNMPDAAFAATERQFLGLLDAGATACHATVEVRRYAFAAVPRGPKATAHLPGRYFPLSELWASAPDLVVVTGSEPGGGPIESEPYRPELLRLLDWALARPTALLLSCLAAHLALHALDGLDRVPLAGKRTGVFAHPAGPRSPLTAGMPAPALVPHSRLNEVPAGAVAAAGWELVLAAPEVGWTAAVGRRAASEVLLLQGHPEYDTTSLLREYRRDALRYLTGERTAPPVLPAGCVDRADSCAIAALQDRILAGPPDPALLAGFDFESAIGRVPCPWRPTAVRLYANWIGRAAARRGLAAPARFLDAVDGHGGRLPAGARPLAAAAL